MLRSVYRADEISGFRAAVMANTHIMGQTRDVAHSYHLAGFHRFPNFASLHARIVADGSTNDLLADYYDGAGYFAIGLSDITVNRSQHWHTDLLRGPYAEFLKDVDPWVVRGRGCLKTLIYLQDGASLGIVPGSHLRRSPLDDAELERMVRSEQVVQVPVSSGDVVVMDIRVMHRGSTDEDMRRLDLAQNPKILLSTVFGLVRSPFSRAMQVGNAHRMADWDRRFLG